jgi:hypothetical protein
VESAAENLKREARESKILSEHMQRPEYLWIDRLIQALESKGYDGFVYSNDCEDAGSMSYIAFRKEQVRPALIEGGYSQATWYLRKSDTRIFDNKIPNKLLSK